MSSSTTSYAVQTYANVSTSPNEPQVTALCQNNFLYGTKDSVWIDPYAATSTSLTLTARDFGKVQLISTTLVAASTSTIVLPPASVSAGQTIEFQYLNVAPNSTTTQVIRTSDGSSGPLAGGITYVLGGTSSATSCLPIPLASNYQALTMAGVQAGTKLSCFSTGSVWCVTGTVLTVAAATIPSLA